MLISVFKTIIFSNCYRDKVDFKDQKNNINNLNSII
jgi:hypothetical protein